MFQDQIKARITFVAMADLERGRRMRRTILHSGRPSIRAASIRDLGMASKLALKTKDADDGRADGQGHPEVRVEESQLFGDEIGGDDRHLKGDHHAAQEEQNHGSFRRKISGEGIPGHGIEDDVRRHHNRGNDRAVY